MELQRHPVAVACLLSCLLALGTSHPDPRQREELIRLEAPMRVEGHVKLSPGTSHPDPRAWQMEELIRLEASMRVGGHVKLSPEEQQLDAHLSKMMREEMAREDFLPALHFFKARPLIRSRPLYGLLQRMPKGTSRTVL